MAPRRNTTTNPKLRSRKKKGQAPYIYPMPALFSRSVRELLRRTSTHFPDNHHLSQVPEEQIPAFIEGAWEHADRDTQAHFRRLADGLPEMQPQSVETEPVVSDVRPPRQSSRARGKKTSTRSRAKRTTLPPPPATQVHPDPTPSYNSLDHTFPATPPSTSSSVSIPLQMVVRSGGLPQPGGGGAPHTQRPDDVLPPYMPPSSTDDFQRDDGAPLGPLPPFPFAPPDYVHGLPPLDLGPPSGPSVYHGTVPGLGVIQEPVDGSEYPVPDVDPSLLDEQRRMRNQMREFYQSLGYAHMSAATEYWPWR